MFPGYGAILVLYSHTIQWSLLLIALLQQSEVYRKIFGEIYYYWRTVGTVRQYLPQGDEMNADESVVVETQCQISPMLFCNIFLVST